MTTDFLDAHHRHWQDAEILLSHERFANADHLYGLAAECGLKRLMEVFGMEMAAGKPKKPQDRKHADEVWQRYHAYRAGHISGTAYGLPTVNPFDNWAIGQRYDHQNQFSQAIVTRHKQGAEEVRNLLKQAQKDGMI